MGEILTSMLQDEGANLLYDKYINFLVTNGYISYEGVPQRCPMCGSKHLIEDNVEIGGFNIPEGCVTEYDVYCENCNSLVAHYAYGSWDYGRVNDEDFWY